MRSLLYLAPDLTRFGGGIEQHARHLLETTAELHPGARLTAVLSREPSLARPELLAARLRAHLAVAGADGPRPVRLARLLAALARAAYVARPDVVACGHVNLLPLARLAAAVAGARLVCFVHGIEAWSLSGAAARGLRAADRVVAVSTLTARRVAEEAGLDTTRIAVLPNAVDTVRFRPGPPSAAVERSLAHLPRPRLLTVARLGADERYKGVEQVLAAQAALWPHRRTSYVVVGGGGDVPRLRALAERTGLPVHFHGRAPDDDLADFYRACDVFVMPSRCEGFGYVFIEALACGLPIVAGNLDGSVDAAADGELGLLVPPLSVDAVAAAIEAHLSGGSPPSLREPARLHAEVERRFGISAYRARLSALWSALD